MAATERKRRNNEKKTHTQEANMARQTKAATNYTASTCIAVVRLSGFIYIGHYVTRDIYLQLQCCRCCMRCGSLCTLWKLELAAGDETNVDSHWRHWRRGTADGYLATITR